MVFEVGRSDAARDWPFIQPGPLTPGRRRRKAVDDPLHAAGRAPRRLPLRIDFTDVQSSCRRVRRDRRRPHRAAFHCAGGGDASLTNPRAGKPQQIALTLPAALFRQGTNEIRLACAEGSWVQYDAITLPDDPEGKLPPAEVASITARPTPFYIRREVSCGGPST